MKTITRNNDAALIPIGLAALFPCLLLIAIGQFYVPPGKPSLRTEGEPVGSLPADRPLSAQGTEDGPAAQRPRLTGIVPPLAPPNPVPVQEGPVNVSAPHPAGQTDGYARCSGPVRQEGGPRAGATDCGQDAFIAPALKMYFGRKTVFYYWDNVAGATHYRLLQNFAGGDEFVQMGEEIVPEQLSIPPLGENITGVRYELTLHRHDWSGLRNRLEACNENQCVSSEPVDFAARVPEAIGYFKASETGTYDHFGTAVALSGDGRTLAVGAPLEDGQSRDPERDIGAVYVYVREGGLWRQQVSLTLSDNRAERWIGISLALSTDGNTLAVGASGNESSGGTTYVFTRSGEDWNVPPVRLKAPDAGRYDRFGQAVALNEGGTLLAVGAPGLSASAATGVSGHNALDRYWPGSVHLFRKLGGRWHHQTQVDTPNTIAGDGFGGSLALSRDGTVLAIGAAEERVEPALRAAGAVYLYRERLGTWTRTARLQARNPGNAHRFGTTLALSADGERLAIGAPGEDGGVSGVGIDAAGSAGTVDLFEFVGERWRHQAFLEPAESDPGDAFGSAIALDDGGQLLTVGARCEGGGSPGFNGNASDNGEPCAGAVYVYLLEDGLWKAQSYLKAPNPEAGDRFGDALALSGDGNTLAVGAWGEDGAGPSIDEGGKDSAADAGAVYLY